MRSYFKKLMMYQEIHKMKREGFSNSRISRELMISRHTVRSYLAMSEQEYNLFLEKQAHRKKELGSYEDFVKSKLEKFPDTSAAQMHDWLKEHYQSFPDVSSKTVYNFVMWVRQKHGIPKITATRQYSIVEETAYGKQAQVDFGQYNMRDTHGKRIKVYFFSMVLSRSRYKYVFFSQQPFTAASAVRAHEGAFEYFHGIPSEIVYDQDKVFLADENKGDLLLTEKFKAYTQRRPFTLRFCRKADPESKGKVENVVKYIKQNFLYNRTFLDIETLNDEVLGWMGRTANMMPHNRTKKVPYNEWIIEQPFLLPFVPLSILAEHDWYTVRKDNTISWKSNLYTLPIGSYKDQGTQVLVKDEQGYLIIEDGRGNEICRHKICLEKGQIISNTDHKREKSGSIDELLNQLAQYFDDAQKALDYLHNIRKEKPRYIRDQLIAIKNILVQINQQTANKTLNFCCENSIFSATDFKSVAEKYARDQPVEEKEKKDQAKKIITINHQQNQEIQQPAISSIIDYESIMKNKN